MNPRFLISGFMTLVCLGAGWGVIAQHRELGQLRAERQTQLTALSQDTAAPALSDVNPVEPTATTAQIESSSELLKLRSEVTRLMQRKQALANVQAENEQLRTKVASRATNAAPGMTLPPGFIRKSQAQMVGFNSPQDTLQTLLWAIHNRDSNTLLQALTPESAGKMQARFNQSGDSMDKFFKGSEALPGMAVVEQQQLPDGSIELKVQVVPGEVLSEGIKFRQINGQWKMAQPF
jgi:hypothetical protein